MKRILMITPVFIFAISTAGCMTVAEHERLMESQKQLYNDLNSRYTDLTAENNQLETQFKANETDLINCRRDLDRCQTRNASLEEQLKICDDTPTVPLDVKECVVTEIQYAFPDTYKPQDWLLTYQVPSLRIKPQKDGVNDAGEQLYWLSAEQLKSLNSANVELIKNVKGWQIWYQDVIEAPANAMQ